ncbi:DUF742 domain-containing protein [Streptosporangium sp. NPDC006930]|uniref:DUF742 domain-containing protein n=1 Tax=unclassified Streptosporangium TaxID=2632669 RepID=UPI00342ADA71
MTQERPIDREHGPIIRPYTMTRGRTRVTGAHFDLMSVVVAVDHHRGPRPPAGRGDRAANGVVTVGDPHQGLQPEHLAILNACRAPTPVVELAARTALAVGVLRVLLGDLRDSGLIAVRPPAPPSAIPRENLLRDLLAGLRSL